MNPSEKQSNNFKTSTFAVNHILSMSSTRRNLRNTNTCPTVSNPFHPSKIDELPVFLPPQLRILLSNTQHLKCDQIHSIPELNPEGSVETEVAGMRQASERQKNEALGMLNIKHKIEEEASIIQVLPIDPEKKKSSHQELVQEIIFQNQLEEFINNPHFDDL